MKILVVHATAGAGHLKAAEAVYDGLCRSGGHEAVLADVLDFTSAFYKRSYQKTYKFLVSNAPWLWGFFFWLLDIRLFLPVYRFLRRMLNAGNSRRFVRYLEQEQFECIVSTHFFPLEVAAALKRGGRIHSRLIGIVTDYDVHSIWVSKGVDAYTVATPFTKQRMLSLGVTDEQVAVTGIPTNTVFSECPDREEVCRRLGVDNTFTVLVATGSFGFSSIEAYVEQLNRHQVVVVCGHNRKLKTHLERKGWPSVKVYGLVDNMHELMAVSDVMLTKPGGLSIAEALVKGLALFFFNPIPGQETGNIRVLKAQGVGQSGLSPEEAAAEIGRLAASAEHCARVREQSRRLGRPHAVHDIIALIG